MWLKMNQLGLKQPRCPAGQRAETRPTDGPTMLSEMKKYYLWGRILNLKPGGNTLS